MSNQRDLQTDGKCVDSKVTDLETKQEKRILEVRFSDDRVKEPPTNNLELEITEGVTEVVAHNEQRNRKNEPGEENGSLLNEIQDLSAGKTYQEHGCNEHNTQTSLNTEQNQLTNDFEQILNTVEENQMIVEGHDRQEQSSLQDAESHTGDMDAGHQEDGNNMVHDEEDFQSKMLNSTDLSREVTDQHNVDTNSPVTPRSNERLLNVNMDRDSPVTSSSHEGLLNANVDRDSPVTASKSNERFPTANVDRNSPVTSGSHKGLQTSCGDHATGNHEDEPIYLSGEYGDATNAEVDDDIDELQKLMEYHRITRQDTQDNSEHDVVGLNQDDNHWNHSSNHQLPYDTASGKPYYDQVPPIYARGNLTNQRLTPSRVLIAQLPSSIKWNHEQKRSCTRQSGRLPPAVMKMSTVMISAKKRAAVLRSMSQYYEDKKHAKLLRWDECVNSRPPLPLDLDLPGPWHYSPCNKPLNETNAPEFTFGKRFYERDGGGRTAHAKTWFNSASNFTTKVNFEKRWPSPNHYNSSKPLLGRRNHTLPDFPIYSIGVRSKFSINKKGSEFEPSPSDYYPAKSNSVTLPHAPSYSFGSRHNGTCISLKNTDPNNPGPGNYTPRVQYMSTKPHRPAFTIKGVRVPKSHMLGPHATL